MGRLGEPVVEVGSFSHMEVDMSARWVRMFVVALVIFALAPVFAVQAAKSKAQAKPKKSPPPAAVATDDAALPPAELTVGFQTRDSETEGLGDLLIPLWNPGGAGLLFLDPRAAVTDDDAAGHAGKHCSWFHWWSAGRSGSSARGGSGRA